MEAISALGAALMIWLATIVLFIIAPYITLFLTELFIGIEMFITKVKG
jgi:hypothetical protein